MLLFEHLLCTVQKVKLILLNLTAFFFMCLDRFSDIANNLSTTGESQCGWRNVPYEIAEVHWLRDNYS